MQRVMCVWIPDWPLARLVLERPELHGRTVVIYEAMPQGGLKVVAATAALGASMKPITGIYPGMPLAEAAALIAHAAAAREAAARESAAAPDEPHLEAADPDADRAALEQLADWCHCFSPLVGLEDSARPDCLLLDVTGLARLFGGEDRMAGEVARWFGGRELAVRVAIADTIGAAWAVVHAAPHPALSQRERDVEVLRRGEALAALAELPISYLRVSEDTVAVLAALGLHRVGQVAALPRGALLSRFGPELLLRLDQASGHVREIISARHVPPEYAADFSFEVPVANREAIEVVLERLIGRISEPLSRRREGVLRLMCRLKYERAVAEEDTVSSNGLLAFSLSLFRPSASPRYLCDLLRLRMENVRLTGPVTSIHVEATAVGPLALCQQPLFDAEVDANQPRRLAELVDRLSNRLGRQAVVEVALLPDAQPEYTCVDVPLAGNASRASKGSSRSTKRGKTRARKNLAHVARYGLMSFTADERPIALLPRPAAIEVIAVTPGGAPGQFRLRGRVHAIACDWGPERIETGWWRTAGSEPGRRASTFVRRDYYRVETKSGARYWIYRNLRTREWFLHGRFD